MANYIMQNSGADLDAAVSAYKNGTIAKAKVGLGNVNNTSDLDKPVSTAVQTALAKKAKTEDVLTKTNTAEFTPTEHYHPATKKYVDDAVSSNETVTVEDVLTSESGSHALSAHQGKVLKSLIDNKANAKNTDGGFIGGDGASASMGAAIGQSALTGNGGAVGSFANAQIGFAGGAASYATSGAAVGYGATASAGFAGGNNAKTVDSDNTPIDAIQLGEGTNPAPKTLQVYGYQLMDANGNIPSARLGNVLKMACGTYTGTGTVGPDYPTAINVTFEPKLVWISAADDNDKIPAGTFVSGTSYAYITPYITNHFSLVPLHLTWGEQSVSWYATAGTADIYQLNGLGKAYHYVVLGG